MSGITTTGFQAATLEELKASIESDQKGDLGEDTDVSAESVLGQINATMADKLAQAWEVLDLAYSAFDPDNAEGYLLDSICRFTGTVRARSRYSEVVCQCVLTSGVQLTADVHVATVAGNPTNKWYVKTTFIAPSTGTHDVVFRSEKKGPYAGNSGTITVISTPVAGWSSVTNALDATLGAEQEKDPALRIRREDELERTGSSTVDAIRVDLLDLSETVQVKIFENTSLETDANGVPGKSVEAVIWDGPSPTLANNLIAQTLWNGKPSGLRYYGSSYGVATDKALDSQVVPFSRATQKTLYLDYFLTTDSTFPIDGVAQVKAAAVAKASQALGIGKDVVALVFRAAALTITGVVDVTSFELGFTASPSGTSNLSVADREIAVLDTSRITVTT